MNNPTYTRELNRITEEEKQRLRDSINDILSKHVSDNTRWTIDIERPAMRDKEKEEKVLDSFMHWKPGSRLDIHIRIEGIEED